MMNIFSRLKGAQYRSPAIYNFLTFLKLGPENDLRFKIAAEFVKPGDSVLDICGGTGALRLFLPGECDYRCLDASAGLTRRLSAQGADVHIEDITRSLEVFDKICDVGIMSIALYHFRGDTLSHLLENLKRVAKKVVIIEETLKKQRPPWSLLQKTINFLSETEYYKPIGLFTKEDFKEIMREHGYQCEPRSRRYDVGVFRQEPIHDGC